MVSLKIENRGASHETCLTAHLIHSKQWTHPFKRQTTHTNYAVLPIEKSVRAVSVWIVVYRVGSVTQSGSGEQFKRCAEVRKKE